MEAITFSRAGFNWLDTLPERVQRNSRKLSSSTLKAYSRSVKRLREVRIKGTEKALGDLFLAEINNEVVRDLIASLHKQELKAATICRDVVVLSLVVHSITKNGDPVFPLKINTGFVSLPDINPNEQVNPCATREQVERALQHPTLAGPVAVAAGAGLRASELLALHVGDCANLDSWDSQNSIIHIRATLKTPAARRAIPIPLELNGFLKIIAADRAPGELLFVISRRRLYSELQSNGHLPIHAYRRFFATTKMDMNPHVLKRIMGHGEGKDVTVRYLRISEEKMRSEMDRCGLGFDLPKPAAPSAPGVAQEQTGLELACV